MRILGFHYLVMCAVFMFYNFRAESLKVALTHNSVYRIIGVLHLKLNILISSSLSLKQSEIFNMNIAENRFLLHG